MPWSVKYNASLGIIESTLSGQMSMGELKEAVSKRISLEKETNSTKVLTDASELLLDATIFEVFQLPSNIYADQEASRTTHIALVLPSDTKTLEAARFYETACRNNGWNVQTFQERQSAIDWLTGDLEAG